MTPDPAAVRAALAEIDELRDRWHRDEMSTSQFASMSLYSHGITVAAARAWLAEQEASE